MKRHRWFVPFATVLISCVLLAACAEPVTPTPATMVPSPETPSEAETPPVAVDTVTISYEGVHTNLDPYQYEGLEDKAIQFQVFDGLVMRNADGEIVPGLAESWEMINDLTWRFHLRRGVTFHNGEPFDAASVQFAVEMYKSDISIQASRFRNILEARIVDDFTVDILLESPDPILPNQFINNLYPLPRQYIEEMGQGAMADHPIGTGPYVFVEFDRTTGLTTLRANPDYWQGVPPINTVIFRPIPEDAARVAALMSGETDIIQDLPPAMATIVSTSDIAVVEAAPAGPRIEYLSLDPFGPERVPAFEDVRVRQAMNYAIDRQGIVDNLLFGFANAMGQPIPAVYLGHNPDVGPYPYDPDRARQLLAEAGYADGFDVTLKYYTRGLTTEEAVVIQANLADVGITVHLIQLQEGQYIDEILAHESAPMFSLAEVGRVGVDASEILRLSFMCGASYNWSGYCNPEVDALIEEGSQSADLTVRQSRFQEANRLISEDAPWIFLWNPRSVWGVSTRIDWSPRGDDVLRVFEDVRPAP